MFTVGPYRFSDTDARRTLAAAGALFDQLTSGLSADLVDLIGPQRAAAADASTSSEVSEATLGQFWEAWRTAMAVLREADAFGVGAVGTVTGLFASDGGVPKAALDRVEIGFGGVVGDRQGNRIHHGRPWQALCLWSTEVIDRFRCDGHPLEPGLAGENISITALPWERVRPGALLRIGDVLAEVSSYATPCSKNAAWFLDGEFDLMHERNGPVARVYATVIEPGAITVGDPALIEI